MKLATFEVPSPVGPIRRIGALVGERLVDFRSAYAAYLEHVDPVCDAQALAAALFPADLVAFLTYGATAVEAARRAIDRSQTANEGVGAPTSYALSEVHLLAPVPRPRLIRDFLTFEGHMRNASKVMGRTGEIPPAWYEVPAYYKGNPETVVGSDVDVQMPRYTAQFDFELEIGMVIGRRGRDIAREAASSYIGGFTIFNDFSARDQQAREAPVGMGPSKGKDFDTGNATGPFLVTPDEIDITNVRMIARVNGEIWSQGSSHGMHFSFADLIAHVSQGETIHPGELWGSGTMTNGCGLELGRWLQAGDVVELEIEGIGVLRNRVVRAP